MLSRYSVGTHQGNEFTPNSSGNVRLQSSQPAEPVLFNPWPKRVQLVRASRGHAFEQQIKSKPDCP